MTSIKGLSNALAQKLSPRGLLAIDSVGALGTATVHGLILPRFGSAFGVPVQAFHALAITAALYCLYSATMAIVNPTRWPVAVRLIATANALFVSATLVLLVVFRAQVTALGVAYFMVEAVLVLAIAVFEWRYTLKPPPTLDSP